MMVIWEWLDIDEFYIPEEFKGQGIGKFILKTAENIKIQLFGWGTFKK